MQVHATLLYSISHAPQPARAFNRDSPDGFRPGTAAALSGDSITTLEFSKHFAGCVVPGGLDRVAVCLVEKVVAPHRRFI